MNCEDCTKHKKIDYHQIRLKRLSNTEDALGTEDILEMQELSRTDNDLQHSSMR